VWTGKGPRQHSLHWDTGLWSDTLSLTQTPGTLAPVARLSVAFSVSRSVTGSYMYTVTGLHHQQQLPGARPVLQPAVRSPLGAAGQLTVTIDGEAAGAVQAVVECAYMFGSLQCVNDGLRPSMATECIPYGGNQGLLIHGMRMPSQACLRSAICTGKQGPGQAFPTETGGGSLAGKRGGPPPPPAASAASAASGISINIRHQHEQQQP
jgi:hypothetical protein